MDAQPFERAAAEQPGGGLDLSASVVAVTGATGFIGRYIVRALLARGARVVGVVRSPHKVPALAAASVELRRADLSDPAALARGFGGVDAIISNAALVALGRNQRSQLIATNVQGTRNVLQAALSAGVTRLLHTSSAQVYKPKRDHVYTEGDPLRSAGDPALPLSDYSISKAEGERAAWRLAERHGLELSTVRPQAVYGAFDDHSFTAYFKRLMAPRLTVFPTHMRFPSVYAGDLAEAMCRILERPVATGRAYNITNEPGRHTVWDLLRAYRAAGGRVPKVVIPFPVPVRRRFVIERAKQDLDWRNRPFIDGFREMLALERSGGI